MDNMAIYEETSMVFGEYVTKARETAIYKEQGELEGLNYAITGFAGEVGEVFNIFQKCMRDDGWTVPEGKRKKFIGEYGGCMWFASQVLEELRIQRSDALTGFSPSLIELTLDDIKAAGSEAINEFQMAAHAKCGLKGLEEESEEYIAFFDRQMFKYARQILSNTFVDVGNMFEVFDAYDENILDFNEDDVLYVYSTIYNELYYGLVAMAAAMTILDVDINEVALENLELLAARMQKNQISGSGDGVDGRN